MAEVKEEISKAKVEEEESMTKVKEVSMANVKEEVSKAKVNEEVSMAKVKEEVSMAKVNEEVSMAKVKEVSKANVKEEVLNFVDLYSRVLDRMIKVNEKIDEAAIYSIKAKFKEFQMMTLNFKDSKYLNGYFYAYSTLNTAIALDRFLNAFNGCGELKECIKKSPLTVHSFGGGPGTDWIAFCSALQASTQEITERELKLVIVELFQKWKEFFEVIEDLVKKENFGYVSDLYCSNTVTSLFKQYNLKKVILKWEADIILLVRVLDLYPNKDDTPTYILKNISKGMNDEALLIIIDTMKHCATWCFDDENKNIFPQFGLERIYKSLPQRFEKPDYLKKYEMLDKNFGKFYDQIANESNANVYVFKREKS